MCTCCCLSLGVSASGLPSPHPYPPPPPPGLLLCFCHCSQMVRFAGHQAPLVSVRRPALIDCRARGRPAAGCVCRVGCGLWDLLLSVSPRGLPASLRRRRRVLSVPVVRRAVGSCARVIPGAGLAWVTWIDRVWCFQQVTSLFTLVVRTSARKT